MKKKFLICAPSYDPRSGGPVVTHKLCSILNELGYEAVLTPMPEGTPAYRNNFLQVLFRVLLWKSKHFFLPYRTNSSLNTPVVPQPTGKLDSSWIVIYPEIVFGNPLNAPNVVRWMLHRPGFHSGYVFYGSGEFLVDFNDFSKGFSYAGSYKSQARLHVLSIPFDLYNMEGALHAESRSGTAYCLRKGKGREIVHDLSDSVLIDGMPHERAAQIFKRVKTFISYDTYTAYSSFATLCGAESIVVPEAGITKEQWLSDPAERYGVAYGFDDLQSARDTAGLLLEHMKMKEMRSQECVRVFAEEALEFFACR